MLLNPTKKSFLLLILLTITLQAYGQEFGGNPPSIKWKQVNTPAAKVIFPAGLDSAGLRVANIVQQMNKAIQPTIGFKQKQISILLQNQTTIANAYVGLAPFRSEFFLTPEQNSFDIGSLPWDEQLAIHEFRHVQQYNNFNVGFSHVLKVLFGEGGQALGNDIAIPNWFFEGDAVFNETHVSEQGRGRLPYFLNGYRALWLAQRNYSYQKLRNGSYRDYTPDWYPLGYMLVSYGRDKYGDDFWKKVTQDAAAYKGVFYPLQKAIKKYSGKDFEEFRNDGLDHFRSLFMNEPFMAAIDSMRKADSLKNKKGVITLYDPVYSIPVFKKHQHFVADNEYPSYVNDSTLLFMRSTYNHIPVFVVKTGDKERNLSVRDISLDNYFAYHDGEIIYATYKPDIRWNYRDYSELALLDVATGKEKRLTHKTKYFAPAFSDDGTRIITVKEGTDGKSELHLLNAANGELISITPNKQHLFYTYPKFYGDLHIISPVRSAKGKMSLALIDIQTGNAEFLLPFTYQPIVFPMVRNDTVYFSATSGINDRLFAMSLKTHRLFELKNYNANFSVGNYEAAVADNKMTWVGFTAFGYQLNEFNKKDLHWEAISEDRIPGTLPDFGINALKRDTSTDLLASVKNEPLAVSKYRKSYHLFNFHSLIPNFSDPNYTLSLAGENVLNTLQTQLSFTYNRDEGYKQVGVDAVYGALFPYISAGADYTLDRRGFYNGSNIYWNETDIHGGLELPLNFTGGKHSTFLAVGSDVYYDNVAFQPAYRALFHDRRYAYSNNYINFNNSTQKAKQNIYPQFGQVLNLNYKTAINGVNATQFLASGAVYLPGVFVNQSLVFNAAHQGRGKDNVINFSNDFPFSRGYTAENLHDMNKAAANYSFPIAYPDAGIANAIYLLRLRGNTFYDYTYATDFYTNGTKFKGTFRSTGAELFFDTQVFNQGSISFGLRYSYLIDRDIFGGTGHNRFEFIVPVTIF